MRICELIVNNFDVEKIETLKFHQTALNAKNFINDPLNKNRFEVIKAGVEALSNRLNKGAIGFLAAAKD